MQEKVADGSIELNKVGGEANLADALTKHVGREIIERHFEGTNQGGGTCFGAISGLNIT